MTIMQALRSAVAGFRPAAGTRQPGELFVNMADRVLSFIDDAGNSVDLNSVTYGVIPPNNPDIGHVKYQGIGIGVDGDDQAGMPDTRSKGTAS